MSNDSILIRLSDARPNGVLRFDLRDLLPLLPAASRACLWMVLDLEIVPGQGEPNAWELARRVEQQGRVVLDWDGLAKLAAHVAQTQNALIAAVRTADVASTLSVGTDLTAVCEMIIEAIDTSYWLVFARNGHDLEAIRSAFESAEERPLSELQRRAPEG